MIRRLIKEPLFLRKSNPIEEGSAEFHGSTEKRTSDQMNSGAFEDRNKKVYFAELETAIDYATGRTAPNDTAVVHEIYSQQKPSTNSISTDGWGFGLGLYSFFKTATNRVHIVRSWKVEKIAP